MNKAQFNSRYGVARDKSHSMEELATMTGIPLKILNEVDNRGRGAWKTNMVKTRQQIKEEKRGNYSRAIGGGLPMSDVIRGDTGIPISKLKGKNIIYAVGNNAAHDVKVVKIGKATNGFQRLKSYIHMWGTNNKTYKSSGAVLLFLRIIPNEFIDIFGDVKSRVNLVESNLIRQLKSTPDIVQVTSRGRETFYSKIGRAFIVSKIKAIMERKSTFTQNTIGTQVKTFIKRKTPKRNTACDSALKALHRYCDTDDLENYLELFSSGIV